MEYNLNILARAVEKYRQMVVEDSSRQYKSEEEIGTVIENSFANCFLPDKINRKTYLIVFFDNSMNDSLRMYELVVKPCNSNQSENDGFQIPIKTRNLVAISLEPFRGTKRILNLSTKKSSFYCSLARRKKRFVKKEVLYYSSLAR